MQIRRFSAVDSTTTHARSFGPWNFAEGAKENSKIWGFTTYKYTYSITTQSNNETSAKVSAIAQQIRPKKRSKFAATAPVSLNKTICVLLIGKHEHTINIYYERQTAWRCNENRIKWHYVCA